MGYLRVSACDVIAFYLGYPAALSISAENALGHVSVKRQNFMELKLQIRLTSSRYFCVEESTTSFYMLTR